MSSSTFLSRNSRRLPHPRGKNGRRRGGGDSFQWRSRSRSRSPFLLRRSSDEYSPSPSPPRQRRKRRDSSDLSYKAKSILDGSEYRSSRTSTFEEENFYDVKPVYSGPEHPPIDLREQKKIQIDIRRSIPQHRISSSPIRRDIVNPLNVHLPRKTEEGCKPIFQRDDIKPWNNHSTSDLISNQKVTAIFDGPIDKYEKKLTDRFDEKINASVRSRLGKSTNVHSRLGIKRRYSYSPNSSRTKNLDGGSTYMDRIPLTRKGEGIKSRLGSFERGNYKFEVKQREVDPEFVPRGRNYYEHDNREGQVSGNDSPENSSFTSRGRFVRDRQIRSRGRKFKRANLNSRDFSDWKHDKFDDNNSD